ncbi:MAG: FHA domain-containing protein [Chromatiales bacterium]|jgi:hypothetical protein|nr:FHA domain-containing protein [Chromatiales bacterium]
MTMQVFAWVLSGVLGIACIVLVGLWLRAKIALAASQDTMTDIRSALEARTHAITTFPDNAILRLLAKGEINVDGKVHNFGVVQVGDGSTAPFLVPSRMDHLVGGDSFSTRGAQLYKVELGAQAAPESEPKNGGSSEADIPARATPPPPLPLVDSDDEDVGNRTVMFAPARGASKSNQDPRAGLPYLHVEQGPDTGTKFALPFTRATVGRDASNIIALGDTGSSRLHCEVYYRNSAFFLKDAASTNGTLCNGEKITEQQLDFGDRVQVADTVMTFSCEGYDLQSTDPTAAIKAFEECLEKEPNFLLALKNLAFLLERDIRRKKDAEPLWRRIIQLEQSS